MQDNQLAKYMAQKFPRNPIPARPLAREADTVDSDWQKAPSAAVKVFETTRYRAPESADESILGTLLQGDINQPNGSLPAIHETAQPTLHTFHHLQTEVM